MINKKSVLFAAAIASSVAGYAADTFGTIQPLPLKVSKKEDAHHVDGQWGSYKANELDFSGTSKAGNGGVKVDYVFSDVPGKLKINLTTPSTCGGSWLHKSHTIYFTIFEDSNTAPDTDGNELRKFQVGNTANEEIILPKTTRRVRFYYKREDALKLCSYTYNLKFDVTKSIQAAEKEVAFTGLLGQVKDTITINYSYPQGDLVLDSNGNEDIKLRKLTEGSEANKEGSIDVEVSYEPKAAQSVNADIIIRDSQYSENFETINITAEATEDFKPAAPELFNVENTTYTTAQIKWDAAHRAAFYKVNVYDNNKQFIETFTTEKPSIELTSLERGASYYIGIVTVADNGSESFESALALVKTNADFGQQLKNADFEAWEAIANYGMEPTSWNSFGTIKEAFALAAMAKAEQVKQSTDIREGGKGQYSAEVYSRQAFGTIWANGNLTTGRINAGSTDAADASKNFNFSDLSNPDHYQVINAIPDSATLWVKYMPFDASQIKNGANISFVVHGDDGVAENLVKEPMLTNNPLRYAVAETPITTTGEWTRISIPFELLNEAPENMTKYILVSCATNGTPGYSTGGKDIVLVDDIVFVYANNVTVADPSKTEFDEGEEITVPFTLEGSFTPSNADFAGNQVTLQLSDEFGNFDNARTISEPLLTDESGEITGVIPTDIPEGSNYRVRAFISYGNKGSEANPTALVINGTGTPTGIANTQQVALNLYPNPARENIVIKGASDAAYKIFNIAGRILKSGNGDLTQGINVADLTEGVYFIEVKVNNQVSILKFIKE